MKKRYLTAAAVALAVIFGIAYFFFILDSPVNFYKKIRIEKYAEKYIEQNYKDFDIAKIKVSYDNILKQYTADCIGSKNTVTLCYSGDFLMEYDAYFNEKYSQKAVKFQEKTKNEISSALNSSNIPFDSVSVFLNISESDKKKAVFSDKEIENGKFDCTVTLKRKDDQPVMDKYELAEYSVSLAECIYASVDKSSNITNLIIRYDYDKYGLAELSWNTRMENMSIYEISNEIKY